MIIYFLQLFLLPSTTATAGVFDLAEYRRVSYDANIGENFLWFAPELDIRKVTASNIDDLEKRIVNRIPDDSTEQNLMFVTSKGGQKFACSLPDVEDVKVHIFRLNIVLCCKNRQKFVACCLQLTLGVLCFITAIILVRKSRFRVFRLIF